MSVMGAQPRLLNTLARLSGPASPMAQAPTQGRVNESGRHHHVANLSIHDGSIFPTSIGANPQLTIYALSARMAQRLAPGLKA